MSKDNFTVTISKPLANMGISNGEEANVLAKVLRDAGYCVHVDDNRIPDDNLEE